MHLKCNDESRIQQVITIKPTKYQFLHLAEIFASEKEKHQILVPDRVRSYSPWSSEGIQKLTHLSWTALGHRLSEGMWKAQSEIRNTAE